MITKNAPTLEGGTPSETYVGVVVSAQGTNPGPASGISYTVDINTANGVVRTTGLRPTSGRLPDTIDTRAAIAGCAVHITALSSYWIVQVDGEWPDWGTCT